MMAARNGVISPGFRLLMAPETDIPPEEWPCNIEVNYGVMARIPWVYIP